MLPGIQNVKAVLSTAEASKIQNNISWNRGRLVRHYFLISLVLISGGLVTSGLSELYFR